MYVLRFGIELIEQKFNQFLRIDFRQSQPDLAGHLSNGLMDAFDELERLFCSLFNALQDIDNPVFPFSGFTDGLQQTVVVRLVLDDVAAQIQNGTIDQFLQNKVEDIHDSTCPAIAIIKRMDAFELIMDDSQLDQSSAKALLAFESAFRIATVSIGAAGGNMGRVSRIMTHDPFYTGNFSIIFPVFCDHESIIAYFIHIIQGIRPLIFHEATPQQKSSFMLQALSHNGSDLIGGLFPLDAPGTKVRRFFSNDREYGFQILAVISNCNSKRNGPALKAIHNTRQDRCNSATKGVHR